MSLHSIDLAIVVAYLVLNALIGVYVQRKATRSADAYFLADRNVPWWMLGLSGCSSYIDIGGTMALVGAMFYLGLKSVWMTHIFWGWLIIGFYMAFQAKYIRRSGVMTFAEWNVTRFGESRATEQARLAAATFLLVLMVCNLMFMAVGTGKFAAQFLPLSRAQSTLIVFGVVGIYVTLGGFKGVIIADVFQTLLIAGGAVVLAVMALQQDVDVIAAKDPGWSMLTPTWQLWASYGQEAPAAYAHYDPFGPMLLAGTGWLIFRVLAGPNVWDFQFFLSTRSARDASLAAGVWTVGYTLRWIIATAFLVLGMAWLHGGGGFDAEKIMPMVLQQLPVGVRGLFLAILLAALMSTLSAMINVTSSVVTNDFVRRYFARGLSPQRQVRIGQLASAGALALGYAFSLRFTDVVTAWETMLFVVVTMILVPATCRWHWWRFGPRAFVWSMLATAAWIGGQKMWMSELGEVATLAVDTGASLVLTLALGAWLPPAPMDTLVAFYSRVRPFGFWGPVRREAVRRGLVPARDRMPAIDVLNGLLTAGLQVSLALVPFYLFLRQLPWMALWLAVAVGLGGVLYFTWYRNLPARDEA